MCVFCQTKALLSLWSWFPNILYPPQWEISRHKHIMTGRAESSLKSLVAKRIFPLWMSAYSLLILQKHSLCSPNWDIWPAPDGTFPPCWKEKFSLFPLWSGWTGCLDAYPPVWYFSLTRYRSGVCGMGSETRTQRHQPSASVSDCKRCWLHERPLSTRGWIHCLLHSRRPTVVWIPQSKMNKQQPLPF